ncbi:phage shock protein PspC (stress-responsive transcriptional regulator) [Sphingomonas jinjuensis]|uniref:Phage shock protein PspC (Stress-responsive transcriptional regulator) n=1 Tax=Sphingomonas jinjuensis TaxID=535907 RepID=A0A840FFM6_9SPHN|nr:phage shock protein PspC (stress-responsive transcriptional regulator) [Sphingomonas jinjuensis]
MQTKTTALLDRSDTFLGVCEGIGQDFGFNANWLRIALGVGLLWNPMAMVGIYAALGLAVLASRLLFPSPKRTTETPAALPQAEEALEPMKIAA